MGNYSDSNPKDNLRQFFYGIAKQTNKKKQTNKQKSSCETFHKKPVLLNSADIPVTAWHRLYYGILIYQLKHKFLLIGRYNTPKKY